MVDALILRVARALGIAAAFFVAFVALATETDAHDQHAGVSEKSDFTRSEEYYQVPDIVLIDQHGEPQQLLQVFGGNDPVLLQFIFTTCATICPVLSASFAAVQDELAAEGSTYQMISITIDPEHDTPRQLRKYADRIGARAGWQFLTGPWDAIVAVQRAFDANYPGNNKMYHRPLTFLRATAEGPWVRFEGLAGRSDLVDEYRALRARRDQTH